MLPSSVCSRRLLAASLITLLVVCNLTFAQERDSDPPSRVARIAFLSGAVSFEPASVDGWVGASLNYPMTSGDNLYTDTGARAVLQIGRNSIRLNSTTNFQFVNLSDSVVQTSINSGGLSVRIRHLFDGEAWEIDTPNGAVTLLRPGEYRVDTDASRNATMVTVRAGDSEVTANNQSFPVHSGETAYFDNSANAPDVEDTAQPDDFDSFVASRDRMEDVPPPQYVSPDMDGYEDLNAYGNWRDTPDYGPVWIPRVEGGWTPYHEGRWAWVDPWGWTWVDDEPWGFAPFHYGRWAYVDNRWGWCPGPVTPRVYYAPALVAFVGGGAVVGGAALVGWFPLGPREPYYPSYHVSQDYIRQVNVTNTRITNINVTNIRVTNINYVNRNAIVAMPQNSFASAQSVRRAAVRVDANQMRKAPVIGTAPRVAPQRASVLATSSAGRASAPPAAIADRPVVARLVPPPRPVPFAARQQLLQQHPGSPVAPAQLQALHSQAAAQNQAPGRMPVRPINTTQVRAVTPTVRHGPARTFAQRPSQSQGRQPANSNPMTQPSPAAHPPNAPGAPAQPHPPVRQTPPTVREQPQPAARPAPPTVREQSQPPVRQTSPAVREQPQPAVRQTSPAVREQPQPPVRQTPPTVREQPQPPVRQTSPAVREQPQPPVRQTPPTVREQPQPPLRPAPPAVREQPQPPVRQAPPAVREQPAPARPQPRPERAAPPPSQKPPPPQRDEKKPPEKKSE